MQQGLLPFKYEVEKTSVGMTSLAGLLTYLDLAIVAVLRESIQRHVKVREGGRGWTDAQVVMALVLLNLAGGDCEDDLEGLNKDEGFVELLQRTETYGMPAENAERWSGGGERRSAESVKPTPQMRPDWRPRIPKQVADLG